MQSPIINIHGLDSSSFSASTAVLNLRLCTMEVKELKLAALPVDLAFPDQIAQAFAIVWGPYLLKSVSQR